MKQLNNLVLTSTYLCTWQNLYTKLPPVAKCKHSIRCAQENCRLPPPLSRKTIYTPWEQEKNVSDLMFIVAQDIIHIFYQGVLYYFNIFSPRKIFIYSNSQIYIQWKSVFKSHYSFCILVSFNITWRSKNALWNVT